jgi:NAD(P)-dependent dehydrogenase (short-subunit alcohol dehydrogenase family)
MRYVSEDFLTQPTRFWETPAETWRLVIETNVVGPFLMARAAVPSMLAHRWGRIVNISMNTETMRRRGFSPYGPSKAALESATESSCIVQAEKNGQPLTLWQSARRAVAPSILG